MVDTVRSLAEIRAALADNVTRQIHPQALRDVVESFSVAAQSPTKDATWQRYNASGIQVLPSSFGINAAEPDAIDKIWDPSGLFPEDDYMSTYWSTLFPRYSWALLTEGLWLLTAITTFDTSTGYRSCNIEIIDDYTTAYDEYIEVYGTTTPTGPLIAADGNNTHSVGTMITVPEGREYRVGYVLSQAAGAPHPVYWEEFSIKWMGL